MVKLSAPSTSVSPAGPMDTSGGHAVARLAPVSSAFFRGSEKRSPSASSNQPAAKRQRALPLPQVGGMPFGMATMRPGSAPVSLTAQAGLLDPSPTTPGVADMEVVAMAVASEVKSELMAAPRADLPAQGVIGQW